MKKHTDQEYIPSTKDKFRDSIPMAFGGGALAYLDQAFWVGVNQSEAIKSGLFQLPGTYSSALINAFIYNYVRKIVLEKTQSKNKAIALSNLVVSANVGLITYAAQELAGTQDPQLLAAKMFGLNTLVSYAYEKLVLQHEVINKAMAVLQKK